MPSLRLLVIYELLILSVSFARVRGGKPERAGAWIILGIVALHQSGRVVGEEVFGGGTAKSCRTSYRSLFERAFERSKSGIVLVHNHPSRSPHPSRQDIVSTRALEALGVAMEIRLFDHLIVGARQVFSMRAAGMLG